MTDTQTDEFAAYSENIFRTIIEESPLPVGLYVGRNMVIRLVNNTILKIWGKDETVIGKTFREALPELEGQPFFKLLDDVYTTGIAYTGKEDLVKLMIDGELKSFYFNFTYQPLKNAEGKVWGVLNTATDITDLVLTRKQLEEAEARHRFALEAAKMGTWDLDTVNELVTWDDRCKQLYGFDKDHELNYRDVLAYIHPEDLPRVDKAVKNAIHADIKEDYDIQFRIVNQNELRWVHCKGKAYFDEHNQPYRFAGTIVDITPEVDSHAEQQKLLFLIENSADFISLTDWDGKYIYLNASAKSIIGFDDLAKEDKNGYSFVTPETVEMVKTVVMPAMVEHGRWSGQINYINKKTGEHIPIYLHTLLIKDPLTQKPLSRATIGRDMRPELEAKKEQQKLITVVENSADLIGVTDLAGTVIYMNKAGKQMMGADSIEECYRPSMEYFTDEAIPFLTNEVGPAMAANGTWMGEINYRHFKTGEAIPVWLNAFMITDPQTKTPMGYASVTRDLRVDKATQQALAKSEELFRKITIAAPAALWMTDTESMITYVNQVWLNWTGRPMEEHLGTGWLNAVIDEDREIAAGRLISDFAERKFHESQFRIQHIDGQLRYIICTGNPQFSNEGIFTGYIGACVDITELKQLQRQKDDFIGIASHELKTPVTSIKAYTQLLESILRRKGEIKEADMIAKMDIQISRLTVLIEDLLDVTKITSGRLQFHQTWFDFNRMMQEVVEDLQRTTAKHTLIEDFNAHVNVYADKDRIGQVLINLITNAIKYSPGSDEIIISSKVIGNQVEVCVQDFGIGIAEDKLNKVFEQFYRVSGDKEHTFPGLGLGLYISSEIITREGGKIWVNSIEGKGSTFCFSLPIESPAKSEI